jgi:hypothetical protein
MAEYSDSALSPHFVSFATIPYATMVFKLIEEKASYDKGIYMVSVLLINQ